MNSEKGQILPLVMVVLAVGSVVITPFIGHAGSNLIGSRVYGQMISVQYSADSGVEHGIWRLIDDGLADELTSPGDSVTYQLGEEVNGETPSVTVTRDMANVAGDDFESGGWSGGSGWLSSWKHKGASSITTADSPYEGSYHLRMTKGNSYVDRAADLSGETDLRLQFWVKVRDFEGNDYMECLVSPDDINWTTVYTWTSADSDNTYHFYDIDLSSFTMSDEYWVAFQSGMNNKNDYFYVDDLKITKQFVVYQVASTAGDRTIKAIVKVSESTVSVISWQVE